MSDQITPVSGNAGRRADWTNSGIDGRPTVRPRVLENRHKYVPETGAFSVDDLELEDVMELMLELNGRSRKSHGLPRQSIKRKHCDSTRNLTRRV